MNNYSKILNKRSLLLRNKAYQQFILDIEGKKVAIPYRINIPPLEHPARQGKSSPEVILNQLRKDAKSEDFNLKTATTEEIIQFMEEHKLGIDCSGFTYRMLEILCEELGMGNLQENGFDNVGRTNVLALTSSEHAIKINSFAEAQPGDIIRLNSEDEIKHCVLIIEKRGSDFLYAQSSGITKITGIHMDTIIGGQLPDELNVYSYNTNAGDGIYRLKVLN